MSITANIESWVRERLAQAEAGHGWLHADRVRRTALHIATREGGCDLLVVELAALLHDIADAKFNGGDEEEGPRLAYELLLEEGLDEVRAASIRHIVRHISFRKRKEAPEQVTPELAAVTDADRLDAMGAIGIARAFHYGGFRNRPIYSPDPDDDGTGIRHFHEKLLLLKDLMLTGEGQRLAARRHAFMEAFLDQFDEEVGSGNAGDSIN